MRKGRGSSDQPPKRGGHRRFDDELLDRAAEEL